MPKVQIISRETIKPSSPTPENLLYLQLSLLDQLAPTMHTPLVLFYSARENIQKSDQLKKSLSDVLMRFYPFAGRIKQDDASGYIHVECNDEGVEFYEARVDGDLSEFLTTASNTMLLPPLESPSVPLLIQLSVFRCGGLAIGVYLSHQIGDGVSLTTFIKSWADASRIGGDVHKTVSPSFSFASLFPPRSMKRPKVAEIFTSKKNTPMKKLVFAASKIALLREKIRANTGLFPSRVEAVSALIWRCALRARGVEGMIKKKPMATHSVNIRSKMEPPLPDYSIGNLILPAFAFGEWDVGDRNNDKLGYLEGRLREAVGKVGGDYARERLKGDGDTLLSESLRFASPEKWEELGIDCLFFNSWCGFPFYESDFGWGKPEQLGFFTTTAIKNLVFLLPTRDEGIEARITIEEEEMERFEQDPELLVFVS